MVITYLLEGGSKMEGLFIILQMVPEPQRLGLKRGKAVFLGFSASVSFSNVLSCGRTVDSQLSNSVSSFYVCKICSWYLKINFYLKKKKKKLALELEMFYF